MLGCFENDPAIRCGRAAARPCGSFCRSIEERQQFEIERQQGKRTARHVERGQEGSRPCPLDTDPTPAQRTKRLAGHDREFHWRRGTEPVDQKRHTAGWLQGEVFHNGANHAFGEFRRPLQRGTRHACLAMDAEAELNLVFPKREAGMADRRKRAGGHPCWVR